MAIAAVLQAQRNFFKSGQTFPRDFRVKQLQTLRWAIEKYENELLEALHKDLHKQKLEAYLAEIRFSYDEIDYAIKHLRRWMRPKCVKRSLTTWWGSSWLYSEPLGVALIMAPWNYPFQLLISPLVGAISAGNCAALKPSELAPATSAVVTRLIQEAFSPEYITIFEGGPEVAQSLLNEQFDQIFFTGGIEIGKKVMAAASKYLTPVVLELGGKSPCIVDENCDLELTAKRLTWGRFSNAGQTCVAPDYVLVQKEQASALIEKIRLNILQFFGANPKESPDYGRIINSRHFDRLKNYLKDGVTAIGGETDAASRYIAPTVLTGISETAPVLNEEIFGPILPIVEIPNLDAAINYVQARPKPLALYYFGTSRAHQEKVLDRLSFGGGSINDACVQLANANLPFGGVGTSGMGMYHGKYSFDAFSHKKSVFKAGRLDFPVRYPPYSESNFRMMKRMDRILSWF